MAHVAILFCLLTTAWSAAIKDPHIKILPERDASHDFSTYAPVRIQCPERSQWVRPATGLSEEETTWVKGRKVKVLASLKSYLGRLHLDDFDLDEYFKRIECDLDKVPTIGMGISGGGWASGMTGTGALRAFDDRFGPAVEQRTGGILQSMTYLSGLSGGSWPVMSLATYNFPEIDAMVAKWHTDVSPLFAPNNTAYRGTPATIFKEIVPKFEAGFNVSFMDYLGRGFGYEFVAGSKGGLETMLSDVTELSNFKNHNMPMPMWQAPQSTPHDLEFFGIKVPSYNATLFEWSPFEFGAWDGPSSFFPTKYLGTQMRNGQPVNECIVGFDRASFMLGLAADAPNFWYIEDFSNGTLASFSKRHLSEKEKKEETEGLSLFPLSELQALQKEFKQFFNNSRDESIYAGLPNPFASSESVDKDGIADTNLTLLDASEMGQSLPLWNQIQPGRNPEFLIAWDDNCGDAHPYSWSNGTNLHDNYIYATNNNIPFPIAPKPSTFINRNYTAKPTFFGCDANLTNVNDLSSPIVLYLPNAPYSSFTNYSWLESTFSGEQMSVILTNGFNEVTQGNGTLDSEWPECLGCAAIDRSLAKVGMDRTEQCQRCMDKYCWDGVEDNTDPGLVDLPLALDPGLSYAEWNKTTTVTFWREVGKGS